jgi:hypothetical protein
MADITLTSTLPDIEAHAFAMVVASPGEEQFEHAYQCSVFRSATFRPSLRLDIPARFIALMCTKTSLPPSSGWMNPKPFWLLNHFTVPVVM